MELEAQIISGLKAKFQFKKANGKWLQEGLCPDCNKHEVFTASKNPKVVKCSRSDNCGYSETVRNILPDLFENWSKRYKKTDAEPNAAADAYLIHERQLDITGLRSAYKQELFKDYKSGETAATIRFSLPNGTYWERIIDRVSRFDRKAHFEKGGNWQGHCWVHPDDSLQILAGMDEIWIQEGIFDAIATRSAFKNRNKARTAVSAMSVNGYPKHFFDQLLKAIEQGPSPKHKPTIIFAFDVGRAGVDYTRKHVKTAKKAGWPTKAAQVKPDGEGTKLDWNDLWIMQQSWSGDDENAPFSETKIDEYLYNGDITIARTVREKADLMRDRYKSLAKAAHRSFQFKFDNRLFHSKTTMTGFGDDQQETHIVTEICNCSFQILYRERDEILDETYFFIRIDFPSNKPSEKARFSAAQCAASAEFKKRLIAFTGSWSGTQEQFDKIIAMQMRGIKTVHPVNFTGYSEPHKTYVLGDIAVRQGQVIKINKENYFDLGKSSIKRRSLQNLLDINYESEGQNFDWIYDIWEAWGVKGIVALAFFTMSAFSVQIRKKHKSLGFLEITGIGGSGKSTLIEALWQSFGRVGWEGDDPNKVTAAYLARAMLGVSNLPVGLIEGNRDEEKNHSKKFDWNELLTLYNGRSPRGTALKTSGNETSAAPFLGSIYLMQNEQISAIPPVLERIMTMNIDKSSWSDKTRDAAVRIENTPIEKMSGTLVHVIKQEAHYLKAFFERFELHNANMAARVEGLYNTRCVKCHSQLAAAVENLEELFGLNPEYIEKTLKFVDQMALHRQTTAGGDHPKVAAFWERVDYIIRHEEDNIDPKYLLNKARKPDQFISINMPHFEQKSRNAGLSPMDMDEVKRHLRSSQSRKFIAQKNVNPICDSKSINCWVFHQPKKIEEASKDY